MLTITNQENANHNEIAPHLVRIISVGEDLREKKDSCILLIGNKLLLKHNRQNEGFSKH
jgi:hypothetical protein